MLLTDKGATFSVAQSPSSYLLINGLPYVIIWRYGDIAQLGERCVRIAEVGGSNPPISTRYAPVAQVDRAAVS